MRCASFNVLADAYIDYGDYSHTDPSLLYSGARTNDTVNLINRLNADVIGLQEAELPLLKALEQSRNWQTYWSPKGNNKLDGCLTITRHNIDVAEFNTHYYSDGSGHVMQTLRIGQTVFANTHIKWAAADSPNHDGLKQTSELLEQLPAPRKAVIFADCNDRPGGPVRRLIENAGFTNALDDEPTAIVNQQLVALDLIAIRGIQAQQIKLNIPISSIPNVACPSDHVPVVTELDFLP